MAASAVAVILPQAIAVNMIMDATMCLQLQAIILMIGKRENFAILELLKTKILCITPPVQTASMFNALLGCASRRVLAAQFRMLTFQMEKLMIRVSPYSVTNI